MKLERDKWLNSLTVMRFIAPLFLKCWFHPIQLRLDIVKDFANMAFMFYSYLATIIEDI